MRSSYLDECSLYWTLTGGNYWAACVGSFFNEFKKSLIKLHCSYVGLRVKVIETQMKLGKNGRHSDNSQGKYPQVLECAKQS